MTIHADPADHSEHDGLHQSTPSAAAELKRQKLHIYAEGMGTSRPEPAAEQCPECGHDKAWHSGRKCGFPCCSTCHGIGRTTPAAEPEHESESWRAHQQIYGPRAQPPAAPGTVAEPSPVAGNTKCPACIQWRQDLPAHIANSHPQLQAHIGCQVTAQLAAFASEVKEQAKTIAGVGSLDEQTYYYIDPATVDGVLADFTRRAE